MTGHGNRLRGRRALVTGAGSGLGRAIAQRLADEGALLTLTDIDRDAVERTADGIGGDVHALVHDVTCAESWTEVLGRTGESGGRLDILVNSAGLESGPGPQDPARVSLADWRAVLSVNVEGVLLGCQQALPLMRQHGGSIVNLASVAGVVATPSLAAYGSAKAAVLQLTRSFAAHCGRLGYPIRCNCVLPGVVLTDMVARFWDRLEREQGLTREQVQQRFLSRIPLGRFQEPVDIANAVLFLASDEARNITGIQLPVDGGFLLGDR